MLGNLFALIILCSSSSIRNKTFNMFLISQSALDFLCAVLLIATAWDIPYFGGGGHFGIIGDLFDFLLKISFIIFFSISRMVSQYDTDL